MNEKPILAVRSYANQYDKAYDIFKNTQNFKNDMWNTSVKYGDINLYLTLLDNTKATKFREEFYNPQYYDYDTMMLDMAKENYDNTEASLSKRKVTSYDETGKEIETETEQEYTDKQWAEIQLNQLYDIRRKEIAAEVEQARKDNMHWLEKTGHTILGTAGELIEGVVTGVTGFIDYIGANFYSMYKLVAEGKNPVDAFVEYFGKGLTALEKNSLRKELDEYEAKYSYIRNLDGSYTDIGKYLGGTANSIGMMIPSIVMNVVAPGSGAVLFYTSMYGNRMYELETNELTKGSPSWLKITNGVVSSAAEATIEWGLGKILGGTVGNKLLGINGNFKIGDIKRLGANILFKSAAQEGLEEVIQDLSTGLVNTFSGMIYAGYGNQGIGGKDGVTMQTLVDSFIMGFGSSLILSGVTSVSNSIKTASEGRIEAKIEKGIKDGSLIEKADGTIVDKAGNKVADSKYITPRIEIDGKSEKVKGLTRFVFNDLVQNFQEAVNQLQNGKGNLKMAQEVFTAFNQLASLYKSFGDERLAKAKLVFDKFAEEHNNTRTYEQYRNNFNTFSAYMISEFNNMVNNAPERINKKLAEEGAKLLEEANKQLEKTETKNITAVATKSDTIVKDKAVKRVENLINKNSKKSETKIDKNKLSDITKDYDWVFITDGKEAFETDKNAIFIPESWLVNYQKTEIYEFIQQNEIIKNIRSYTGFTSLLEFIDKTYEDLSGNKITNKNRDEALINFLFNEKFYQYVLFSNIDKKSKLGKFGTTEFKNVIFKLHTIVSELANKAKTEVNKNLIKKLQKEMLTAQRKPTIKAIVHWNIDPQAVGADNILTKEDRELVQKAQALKKNTGVQAVLGKQVSQAFIRRHQKTISAAEKNITKNNKTFDSDKILNSLTKYIDNLNNQFSEEYKQVRRGLKTNNEYILEFLKTTYDLTAGQIEYVLNKGANNPDYKLYYFKQLLDSLQKDLVIDKAKYQRDKLIVDGLKDNASKIDRLKAFILLEEKMGLLRSNQESLITLPLDVVRENNLADIEVYNDVNIMFEKEYGVSFTTLFSFPKGMLELLIFDGRGKEFNNLISAINDTFNLSLSTSLVEEVLYSKDTNRINRILRYVKEFVVRKLRKELGNTYFVKYDYGNEDILNSKSISIFKSLQLKNLVPEVLTDEKFNLIVNHYEKFYNEKEKCYSVDIPLYDILNFSNLTYNSIKYELTDIRIRYNFFDKYNSNFSPEYNSVSKTISLSNQSKSLVSDFSHELNHVFQHIFSMKKGGDPDVFGLNAKNIEFINKNFKDVIDILVDLDSFYLSKFNSNEELVSFIGYLMLEGELFARYNEELARQIGLVSGIERTIEEPRMTKSFKVSLSDTAKENIALSRMEISFDNMQLITDDLSEGTRDTYHSALTNKSTYELVNDLVREDLSILDKISLNLDTIIKNPKKYLKEDILISLRQSERDVRNEGDVYYFLKSYLEKKFGNISIDRSSVNNTYIFVNDGAFNDLIKSNIGEKLNDNNDLVEDLKSTKLKLSDIYNKSELNKLKVPDDIEIVTGNNFDNEFVVDKEHPAGIIYINTEYNDTNIGFIRAINHEFRHLLQYYYNFEQGFTIDFLLTKEQLNDIKEHVPEIFTDKENIEYAEFALGEKATKADKENLIGRMFIYYMNGGEQNAYGIKANFLMNKPCYVRYDGGNPTIFMPWYDGKNGKYETKFIANRAMNKGGKKSTKQLVEKKLVSSFDKTKGKYLETTLSEATYKNKPKEKNSRYFSNAKAKGTLLENFIHPKKKNQMDPNLQEFVIQATPLYDILPNEIKYAIDKGTLTAQQLYHWFRRTNKMKPEVFDLINNTMFKNKYIESMDDLNKLVEIDIEKAFTLIVILMKQNIDVDAFFKKQNIPDISELFSRLEKSKDWGPLLSKEIYKFRRYYYDNKTNYFDITDDAKNYIKSFAMRYYDGTISSLFLIGRVFRKVMRQQAINDMNKNLSLDRKISGRKGEGGADLGSLVDEGSLDYTAYAETKDIIKGFELSDNTDLYKLFAESNELVNDAQENIDDELTRNDKEMLLTENQVLKFKQQGATATQLQTIAQKALAKLSTLSDERINEMYEQLKIKEMSLVDTTETINDKTSDNTNKEYRVDLVGKIKRRANKLKKELSVSDWKLLSPEVQEMFDGKGAKAVLKKEVYSVGYANKTTGPAPLDKLSKNLELLNNESQRINAEKELKRKGLKAIERIERNVKKRLKKELVINSTQSTKLKDKNYETEIRVKTQKGRTEYHVYSSAPMPDIVKDIFDTSFNHMRDTKVKFTSRDEAGNLYTKDSEEFKSAQKHEVSNWDAFYEANHKTLNNLTRSQVVEIVEFIVKGNPISLDESTAKLEAFKIFLLGYILDGARSGIWEMAQRDIDQIERYYEQLASTAGSTLAAVNQMIKVVNPVKQIRQLMLDKYKVSPAQIDSLSDSLDKVQAAKSEEAKNEAYKLVSKNIKDIEKTIAENQGKRGKWEQIKSVRFMTMLSGPLTWLRNLVSNHIVTKFNKAADTLGSWIFKKKDFRKGQWDLTSTEISQEVAKFINDNVKNSPLLDDMYDASTKYDTRARVSKKQKELFITLVTNSIESKYAAEHRFNNEKLNLISNFVSKMISDKKFIKGAALKYLGKILTIENNAGRVKLNEGLSTNVLNLFAEAVIIASQDYMHKRSFFADMLDGLRTSDNFGSKAAYEIITTWQPFLNSGWNWFVKLLDYTPIGIAKGIYQMRKLEKSINAMDEKRAKGHLTPDSRVAEYLARRSIGSGILGLILSAVGFLLTSTGLVKIEDDDDEFRLKIGDISVDISDMFGTSTLLCGMALGQLGSKSLKDILKTMTTETTNGFILIDILDRYQYSYQSDGALGILLTETENFLKSFVPNMWQQVVRGFNNNKIKYSSGIKGLLIRTGNAFLPIFGEKVINIYSGEPQSKYALPYIGEWLKSGALFGVKIFTDAITDEEIFAQSYGVNKAALNGKLTVNGVEYKINDSYALNVKYGELNKKALAQLPDSKTTYKVQMPDGSYKYLKFSNMSDKQKKLIIERVMEANAKIAKIYQWTNEGHKYYASSEEYNSLKKLGITNNIYLGDKGFVK